MAKSFPESLLSQWTKTNTKNNNTDSRNNTAVANSTNIDSTTTTTATKVVNSQFLPDVVLLTESLQESQGSCCDNGRYYFSNCGNWWYHCPLWGLSNFSQSIWFRFGENGVAMPPITVHQGTCSYTTERILCALPDGCSHRIPILKNRTTTVNGSNNRNTDAVASSSSYMNLHCDEMPIVRINEAISESVDSVVRAERLRRIKKEKKKLKNRRMI